MIEYLASSTLDRKQKDAILLYDFCSKVTSTDSGSYGARGISKSRLHKLVSALIRHQHVLYKSVNELNGCYLLSISHGPHRFGQMAIRSYPAGKINREKPHHRYEYLENILKGDDTLKALGVVFTNGSPSRPLFFRFPPPDFEIKKAFIFNSEITPEDRDAMEQLASFYAALDKPDFETLATCPTEDATMSAMIAEVNLFYYDINQILSQIEIGELNSQSQGIVYDHLVRAYRCANEILTKRDWYQRIPEVKTKIANLVNTNRTTDQIARPLLDSLGTGAVSNKIQECVDVFTFLLDYLGLVHRSLNYLEYRIVMSEDFITDTTGVLGILEKIPGGAEQLLEVTKIGLTNNSGNLKMLGVQLRQMLELLGAFLADASLPSSYKSDLLFNQFAFESVSEANKATGRS